MTDLVLLVWQNELKIALPCHRIIPGPVLHGLSPPHNNIDTLHNPSGCLLLGHPDGIQTGSNMLWLDSPNRHIANVRKGISPQRVYPLVLMLSILPFLLFYGMERICSLCKRHGLKTVPFGFFRLTFSQGVIAVCHFDFKRVLPLSGLFETDKRIRPQSSLSLLALHPGATQPTLAIALRYF